MVAPFFGDVTFSKRRSCLGRITPVAGTFEVDEAKNIFH